MEIVMDNTSEHRHKIKWTSRSELRNTIEEGIERESSIQGDNQGVIYTYSKNISLDEALRLRRQPNEFIINLVKHTYDSGVLTAECITSEN